MIGTKREKKSNFRKQLMAPKFKATVFTGEKRKALSNLSPKIQPQCLDSTGSGYFPIVSQPQLEIVKRSNCQKKPLISLSFQYSFDQSDSYTSTKSFDLVDAQLN